MDMLEEMDTIKKAFKKYDTIKEVSDSTDITFDDEDNAIYLK